MAEQSRSGGSNRRDPNRGTPPLPITVDRGSLLPVFRQIYEAIREAILSGRLPSGSRLPPSRELAADLAVSRATAVLALEHLEAEGYVEGRGAAGTFVAALVLPPRQYAPTREKHADTPLHSENAGGAPAGRIENLSSRRPVPFRLGEPALDAFPEKLWARLYAGCVRDQGGSLRGYGDTHGHFGLRRAIAGYVSVSRSVKATTEQVILVRGAQQAVDLVARVLLSPGDRVWIEDPGYLAARTILELAGAELVPIPVDGEGLDVAAGIRTEPAAKMACVAPSHHFPLGRTLSLPRRLALLEWARGAGAWIVEDDFDSEFRYSGTPLASLQGLDASGRVLYVGTFSKTVYPALRLGYLIVPPELVERFRAAAAAFDHFSPTLDQATLARFIEEGHFTRHIRRMRAVYRERQEVLLQAASRDLDGLLRIEPAGTGMHVVGWLSRSGADAEVVAQRALERGIEVRALSRYCMRVVLSPALVLGFAASQPKELMAGVRALRGILVAAMNRLANVAVERRRRSGGKRAATGPAAASTCLRPAGPKNATDDLQGWRLRDVRISLQSRGSRRQSASSSLPCAFTVLVWPAPDVLVLYVRRSLLEAQR
jgi:GntR family transcriptional regulator/MocR family aminotransferase